MCNVLPLRRSAVETPAPPAEAAPLLVDARKFAALLGCGLRTIRTMDSAGRLPAPIRLGGKVLWRVSEIHAWLEAGAPDRETWAAIRATRK